MNEPAPKSLPNTESIQGLEILRTNIIRAIDLSDARFSVRRGRGEPSDYILSNDPNSVLEYCGSFASPFVTREVNRLTGHQFRSVVTTHDRPAGYGHAYMVERSGVDPEEDLIVDPTAGQFLEEVPEAYRVKGLIKGNMFIGTRRQLREMINNPDLRLFHISTYQDKALSFSRIWGDTSKDFGVTNPNEFYAQ